MDTELLILIFFFILNILTYVLLGYFVYSMVKNIPKYLKSRNREEYASKKDFIIQFENKEVKKVFTLFVIVLYLLVIEKTLWLYFFPDPDLNIIFQDFRQHAATIEIIFTLLVLGMIPAFLFIKREFNAKLKKMPFPLTLALSTVGPVYALANNWFTGNLLFSGILIAYGVLFAVFALKFNEE